MTQPLAYIHPDARIAPGVIIDPFVSVAGNVEIGEGTHLMSGCVVMDGARIGRNCRVFPGAVVAGIPQDLKFRGEDTLAIIGDNCTLRECVTINRGTASKGRTVVGNNCLIMAYSHVAHDCVIGNNVIISNASQIAGEVVIDDNAVIGGGSLCHQFCHLGPHVMIQGGTRLSKDIPPYSIAGREPVAFCGVNKIGLSRRGFTPEQIEAIENVYRMLFNSGLNISDAVIRIESELPNSPERDLILTFIKASTRGIITPAARR